VVNHRQQARAVFISNRRCCPTALTGTWDSRASSDVLWRLAG